MIQSEEHWLTLTDAFYAAALDGEGWQAALEGLADATGSRVGELVCFGRNANVPVNIVTGLDPAFHDAFVAAGGGDPAVNPRVRAGMAAPVLKVLAESDFITPEEYKRDPHYQEFAIPWNIPYICLATLERNSDMLIGLAVARTRDEGHISDNERDAFQALAPHVRAAVRMQMTLEGRGLDLLTGTLEKLAVAAFVCDAAGCVRMMTPAAEEIASGDGDLRVRLGQLHAARADDDAHLKTALAVAAEPGAGVSTVVLRDAMGTPAVALDVLSLPRRASDFNLAPGVLVVARGEHASEERRAAVLRAAYGLTATETAIAMRIAGGDALDAIAAQRGVSVGTVRTQVKSIFAKFGVSRQAELAAKISRF